MKLMFYILSVSMLFFFIGILKLDIPLCWSGNCQFIGWGTLLSLNWIGLGAIGLGIILSMISYNSIIRHFKNTAERGKKKVSSVEDMNSNISSFIASYILPLMLFPLDSLGNMMAFALFLYILGVIYCNTDDFFLNPVLFIFGFRFYTIRLEGDEQSIRIITRKKISAGKMIIPVDIAANIVFYAK